jgi:bifunctional ADP-heptose synthase (sugar kinase/adenylyltransferase)
VLKQEDKEARQRGERIMMTNGCFYILQAGHERYFIWKLEIGNWELGIEILKLGI